MNFPPGRLVARIAGVPARHRMTAHDRRLMRLVGQFVGIMELVRNCTVLSTVFGGQVLRLVAAAARPSPRE